LDAREDAARLANRSCSPYAPVDAIAVPSSNGNRVLESGELVVVQPWWRNVNGAPLAFDGVASAFFGFPGPVYTLADGNAGYGSLPSNTAGSCGAGAGCYAMRVTGARPTPHWDSRFQEDILPAVLGQSKVWTLHIGDTFTDVTRTNPFYRYVETVLHKNVMIGCSPSLFCPFVVVSRDRMAEYVLKSKEPTVPTACVAGLEMFADVPASNPYCRWIEELARRGVVSGCGGGNYCPSSGVSREQLAVFLLKTLEGIAYVPPACGAPMFNDVPAGSSFCRYVEELARRGVVTGCGGGAYCPTFDVARDQMSVFLSVTFALNLYGP
jgi:S-layer homology domain